MGKCTILSLKVESGECTILSLKVESPLYTHGKGRVGPKRGRGLCRVRTLRSLPALSWIRQVTPRAWSAWGDDNPAPSRTPCAY